MPPCPPNSIGAFAGVGGTTGSTIQFHNTSMFVAYPNAIVKVGLIGFPDIFGLDSGRTKSDAEALAKLGYATAVVGVADGDYLTEDTLGDVPTWLKTHTWEELFEARTQAGIEYLRSEFDVESVIAYRYCLGGWVAARQSGTPDPIIKGAVSFHPSWGFENDYNGEGAVEKLAERISVPQVLMSAGNDPDFVRENGTAGQILAANPAISNLSKVIDFPDMVHGWVNRGNLSDPATAAAVNKAWRKAILFFRKVVPKATGDGAFLDISGYMKDEPGGVQLAFAVDTTLKVTFLNNEYLFVQDDDLQTFVSWLTDLVGMWTTVGFRVAEHRMVSEISEFYYFIELQDSLGPMP